MDRKNKSRLQNIFKLTKKEQFKYHVLKYPVSSAGIIDRSNGKFFNNTSWQERKKLDCARFAEEFEDLNSLQESDILLTFLVVSSPYIIRKEYLHLAIKFKTDFSNKTVEEKAEILKKILNVAVDEKYYRSILYYAPGKQAIESARNNVATKFNKSISVEPFHVGISNDSASNEQIDSVSK